MSFHDQIKCGIKKREIYGAITLMEFGKTPEELDVQDFGSFQKSIRNVFSD